MTFGPPIYPAQYVNFGDGSTTGYYALPKWQASHAYTVGTIIRPNTAPAVGNERAYICTVAGTSSGTEPTWTFTHGAKLTDGGVTWVECTGQPAVNGDATNTPTWQVQHDDADYANIGDIIQNTAGTYFFINGSGNGHPGTTEPTWNTTIGATTVDNQITWTCIGTVSAFSAWQAPHARLINSLGSLWTFNGQTKFIGDNSNEGPTNANTQLGDTSAIVGSDLNQYICVDHTAAVPPTAANWKTGAVVNAGTGTMGIFPYNNSALQNYYYGITFQAANLKIGAVYTGAPEPGSSYFDTCTFKTTGTTNPTIVVGSPASSNVQINMEWVNCSIYPSAAGTAGFMQVAGLELTIRDTPSNFIASGATVPYALLDAPTFATVTLTGLDISGLSTALVHGTMINSEVFFLNSKINASVAVSTGLTANDSSQIFVDMCDSGGNEYKMSATGYRGTVAHSNAVYNDAGSVFYGVNVSQQMVASSNVSRPFPLWSREFFIDVPASLTGASRTVTVEMCNDGSTLTSADIWLDVAANVTSGSTKATTQTTAPANFGTSGSAYGTSTATWTTTGLTSPVKQKMQATFTPQVAGTYRAVVKLARASTTVYVDAPTIA